MPAGSGIAAKGSIEVVDPSHSRELARAGEASVLARLARLGLAAACAGILALAATPPTRASSLPVPAAPPLDAGPAIGAVHVSGMTVFDPQAGSGLQQLPLQAIAADRLRYRGLDRDRDRDRD